MRRVVAPIVMLQAMFLAAATHTAVARPWLPKAESRTIRLAPTRPPGLPTDAELQAVGAVIGDIHIRTQPIFDTTRLDEDAELFRLANRLHLSTRENTIATQLLFAPGDRYEGRVLEETARLLRDTRYLQEAYVTPIAFHDGRVDIEVLTYDVWTLTPGISFGRKGGRNTSGFEIEEMNLLGTGARLSATQRNEIDRNSTTFLYQDRQLAGTWWSLAAQYSNNSDGRTEGITLDHDFFALDSRWAAGVNLLDDDRIDHRYDGGGQSGEYQHRSRYANLYGGWSRGLKAGAVLRWRTGFTYDDRRFDAPRSAELPTTPPPDRKLVYPWVSAEWLQDDFRVLRNRDQIERTEDIRYGWRLTALLGHASRSLGADRDAWLLSAGASRGIDLDARGSLLFESTLQARHEHGAMADALWSVSGRYYLRQSERRLFFASLTADIGHALDVDRSLTSGGDTGLRGYPLRYQGGQSRWLFTLEQRAFTNWYPFRLANVGAAAFLDVGRSIGQNPYGNPAHDVLADVGIGLRLGNNRSALGNVLHIDLAAPLKRDRSIKSWQFVVETKRSF